MLNLKLKISMYCKSNVIKLTILKMIFAVTLFSRPHFSRKLFYSECLTLKSIFLNLLIDEYLLFVILLENILNSEIKDCLDCIIIY